MTRKKDIEDRIENLREDEEIGLEELYIRALKHGEGVEDHPYAGDAYVEQLEENRGEP